VRLRDLDAYFIRYETRIEECEVIVGDAATWNERGKPTQKVTGPREYMVRVETLAEAQGIFLQCPKCARFDGESGAEGLRVARGHYLQVTFADRGVADSQGCHGKNSEPTRWQVLGTGLDDLTTKPSILLYGGCEWHGCITNGDAA
jgi:hypothetical protein